MLTFNDIRSVAFSIAAASLLLGCAAPPERELSVQLSPNVALMTGKNPLDPERYVEGSNPVGSLSGDLFRAFEVERGHALTVVQLSGGGQNGAFGAGIMKGWTRSGKRPEFDFVTGVSTGALLATHAFLGTPADDAVLEEIFTGVTARDVFTKRGVFGVLGGGSSLLDTAPLDALLERHITEAVVARVAVEYAKGRRLLIGTTNLDYKQTWVWNMGAIAEKGDVERYRTVLKASSAFPIMFPPVEIDGHLFADGAVRANLVPLGFTGEDPPAPPLHGPGTIYVIENGKSTAPPKAVRKGIVDLASTSIGDMMASSMDGLMTRAYVAAQVQGYHYRTVAVPPEVDIGGNPLAFDPDQMQAAFDAGYELGQRPETWATRPPLFGGMPEWMLEVVRDRL